MKLPISKCGASRRDAEAQRRSPYYRILSASPRLRAKTSLAFSLIEVVLAVGVISFALVGIIGLFPVAMQSALDSQRETQVAFIARSLFSELQRVNGDEAYITVPDPATTGLGKPEPINLNPPTASTSDFFFDQDGGMLNGDGPTAMYRAEVTVNRTGQPDGLSRVDIKIFVPNITPPPTNQRSYNFVTLISFTPSATP
jgi:uncharacterized protein (TIGR02598 family)